MGYAPWGRSAREAFVKTSRSQLGLAGGLYASSIPGIKFGLEKLTGESQEEDGGTETSCPMVV